MAKIKCVNCLKVDEITTKEIRVECSCDQPLIVEHAMVIATIDDKEINDLKSKINLTESIGHHFGMMSNIAEYLFLKSKIIESQNKDDIKEMHKLASTIIGLNDTLYRGNKKEPCFDILVKEIFLFLCEYNDTLAKKKILMFQKDDVTIPVQTISGWLGPKSTTVDLEDIISFDTHLEVLRDYDEIKMISRNLFFHTYSTYRTKDKYNLKCLVVNDDVTKINNALFPVVDTLVYLGSKGFPTMDAFRYTKAKEVIFINAGFLGGNNFLVEGCSYIINHYDTFNDKENFIKTLNKKTDKIRKLIYDIIVQCDVNCIKFLLDNNLAKYDIMIDCLKEELTDEKKVMLVEATNNSSSEEKELHTKAEERKENLDLGFDQFTLKDFKRIFNCAKVDDTIEIATYKLSDEIIVFPGSIDGLNKYVIKKQKDNIDVKKIYFEEGVKEIKATSSGFDFFYHLEELHLPSTLEYIDEHIITNLKERTNVYIGDDKIYVVANNNTLLKVNGLSNVKDIVVPNGVKKIISRMFSFNRSIESVSFPKTIEVIGGSAFSYCEKLSKVQFEVLDCKLKINHNAFSNCDKIKEINLPEGTIYLGDSVFSQCKGLTKVSIPSTVKTMVDNPFANCKAIEDFDLNVNNKHFKIIDDILYSNNQLILALKTFNSSKVEVLDGITSICTSAFHSNKTITEVVLPETVEAINWAAFAHCSNLVNINLPSKIKLIDSYAFYSSGITKALLPNIETIEYNCFAWCKELCEIYIPNTVTKICESAFQECDKLHTFEIPTSVATIERLAFSSSNKDRKDKGVIYTEVPSQPYSWDRIWTGGRKVQWGKKRP